MNQKLRISNEEPLQEAGSRLIKARTTNIDDAALILAKNLARLRYMIVADGDPLEWKPPSAEPVQNLILINE